MSFQLFAEQHGLIINDLEHGRWVRVPTVDHPHKKNGCYIFEGTKGAVQNWAVHEKPVTWFSGAKEWVPDAEYKAKVEKAKKEKEARQRAAAKKAAWILNNSTQSTHPCLVKKGFPEAKWHVWNALLIIPMRLGNTLVGCQMIDAAGSKKFLSGQLTKGVHCGFDQLSMPFPSSEIQWRVGSTTKDKSKGMCLAYVDARVVMDRLIS